MSIPREALESLICYYEGYLKKLNDGTDRVVPYLCPAGVPTIGYGSIWRLDGSRVELSDPPITRDQAMALMMRELSIKCEPAVDRYIATPLHELSRGALVSFVYNLGEGAFKGSTLRKVINARQWCDVASEFMKWRMAKGVVLRGLERRRASEAQMFLRGVNELRGKPPAVLMPWQVIVQRAA